MVKPSVRSMQGEDGVITIDDSIVEKPYTDENELICWHYDHAQGRMVRGINFITALYTGRGLVAGDLSVGVKTESHMTKRATANDAALDQERAFSCHAAKLCAQPDSLPLCSIIWFASAENMSYVKLNLDEFIMALKTNRKIALCQQDKLHGRYHRLNQLDLPENTVTVIYLEQVSFPLYLLQTCTNAMARPLCAIW